MHDCNLYVIKAQYKDGTFQLECLICGRALGPVTKNSTAT